MKPSSIKVQSPQICSVNWHYEFFWSSPVRPHVEKSDFIWLYPAQVHLPLELLSDLGDSSGMPGGELPDGTGTYYLGVINSYYTELSIKSIVFAKI
jgi:hypothetical protein